MTRTSPLPAPSLVSRRRRLLGAVVALIGPLGGLLLSLGGCSTVIVTGQTGGGGSGSEGVACSATFTPCGGDITGTWVFDSECNLDEQFESPECVGATSDVSYGGTTGTYTFNADETYAISAEIDTSGTVTIPGSCLTGLTSCSQLGSGGPRTCTGDVSQSCVCTFMEGGMVAQQGTYTTSGNSYTLDGSTTIGYCVHGSQLLIGYNAVGGGGSPNVYVIYTKQ